ncbi:MAG: LCP family protein [Nocardioides sp.]|uniref:LCP family protein n=1 Tax=Nocardioides sp. TaxID=35761 RepID=UPI003D6C0E34
MADQNYRPQRTAAERASRVRFRRAMALLLITLLLPGSAQLVAGNRRVGRIAIWTVIGLAVTAGLVFGISLLWHGLIFRLGTTPWLLGFFRIALIAGALAWAALFVDAWRLGRPLELDLKQRRIVVAINGALAFSVAATMIFGAHLVGVHKGMVETIFAGAEAAEAHNGRFNVLLAGADGDSGKTRWGLRPDSLTVASIDAVTGRTVLIGLPRNMQNFTFDDGSPMDEEFPRGFDCDGCYLNGVSTWAGEHKDLYKDEKDPGMAATVDAVEGITDLQISYYAMVDLNGFEKIVDAIGGVTLNVRQPIPVGIPSDKFYTHIEPGKKKLDGWETLWYARARHDSDDYSRMARQKCVMSAILQQTSPADVVRHYQDVAKATGATITTTVPPSEIERFSALALKAKSQKVSTLSLVPPLVSTADPDMSDIHAEVRKAVKKATPKKEEVFESPGNEGDDGETKAPATKNDDVKTKPAGDSGDGGPVTGGALGSRNKGYQANETDDLASAC